MFYIRTKKHELAIRNNNSNSVYSNGILNMGHSYGTILDTRNIINAEKRKSFTHISKIPHIQNQ